MITDMSQEETLEKPGSIRERKALWQVVLLRAISRAKA